MKLRAILPVLVVLVPFFVKAQITVTCDGKVGLGNNNTSPVGSVDVLGAFSIRPSSSGSYAGFGAISTYGWTFGSSSQYTGYIGYYSTLYALMAQYVYATNMVQGTYDGLLIQNGYGYNASDTAVGTIINY